MKKVWGLRTLFLVVAFLFAGNGLSFAAGYPEHNIQFIIPNVAGSQMDITARLLASEMEKTLGVKIIPNNKPGAGTILGAEAAIRAKKDGYTLFYAGNNAFVTAPACTPEVVRYDPVKDAEPLGFHYFFPLSIAVRSDAPWKTFSEFIDYAKKNPAKIRVSTTGVGSGPHLIVETIQAITGTKLTHVPFEGGESIITAVLGGHVEATCDTLAKVKPHVDAGRMKVLLITNKMPAYPDMPTITELGYKQPLYGGWFGMYAPAGIPEEAKNTLVRAVEKAVKATKPRIDALGNLCEYKSPSEQRKMAEEEYKKALEVAVRIGMRKQ